MCTFNTHLERRKGVDGEVGTCQEERGGYLYCCIQNSQSRHISQVYRMEWKKQRINKSIINWGSMSSVKSEKSPDCNLLPFLIRFAHQSCYDKFVTLPVTMDWSLMVMNHPYGLICTYQQSLYYAKWRNASNLCIFAQMKALVITWKLQKHLQSHETYKSKVLCMQFNKYITYWRPWTW